MIELVEVETTFWGVPADASHDPMRGVVCSKGAPPGSGIWALMECQREWEHGSS